MRTIADINLESALYELRPACRIAADRLDEITPMSRAADTEAVRWIANQVELHCREAERNGAPAGLADAGRALADAAERLDTLASIRRAWDMCEAVEASLEAALAHYGLPEPYHAGIALPPAEEAAEAVVASC